MAYTLIKNRFDARTPLDNFLGFFNEILVYERGLS